MERLTELLSFSKYLSVVSPLVLISLCVSQHELPLQITPAAVLGVSLSTPPSTIFQIGVNKDDMEENDDYSNVSLDHICHLGCHTNPKTALQEEFEEDQEDSNIMGDFVGDMQSNTPIQLRYYTSCMA